MLPTVRYGSTGMQVTRLSYGTGHLGGRRMEAPVELGARLISQAFELGVNFFDTACSYGTHPHVAEGLRGIDRSQYFISTKTGAKDLKTAESDIEQAPKELHVDYVDCFLLHGVRTEADYEARQPVLEALLRAKEQGITRHVGASTHIYSGALPSLIADPRIEVILTVGSKDMLGLRGATPQQQLGYIAEAEQKGKAVCLMKVLGEGRAADQAEEYIRYALDIPGCQAITIGFSNEAQIEMAAKVVAGQVVPDDLRQAARRGAQLPWAMTYPDHYD